MRSDPERQQARRQAILEAAARAMATGGFHGMTMRELAGASGLGLSSLYTYFRSKEEILFALQQEAFRALLAAATEATAGGGEPEARLYAFISQHVHYFARHPEVMRVLIHEAGSLPPARRRAIRRLKERYFAIGREIIRELIEEGCGPLAAAGRPVADEAELDRITYCVFGMLNWIYGWYRPGEHGSPRELARTLHRVALCGLVAGSPFGPLQEEVELNLAALEPPPLLGIAAAAGGAP